MYLPLAYTFTFPSYLSCFSDSGVHSSYFSTSARSSPSSAAVFKTPIMSVVIETTKGIFTVDLYTEARPKSESLQNTFECKIYAYLF